MNCGVILIIMKRMSRRTNALKKQKTCNNIELVVKTEPLSEISDNDEDDEDEAPLPKC